MTVGNGFVSIVGKRTLTPATLDGTFKTVETVTSEGGGLSIEHTAGTAAVVPCP